MPDPSDDFESVRRDPDPIRRGRRATKLLTLYQQRSTELARLRKAAIEEIHDQSGMSYTEIATSIGLTKGRISQIRLSAPRPERLFFGVGPVSVGVPYRYRTTDRERPLIAAEDARTGDQFEQLLGSLALAVDRFQIEPEDQEAPAGDSVVVCGPKSASIGANLIARDPILRVTKTRQRWWIERSDTRERFGSPSDDEIPQSADIAYLARHVLDGRVILHVAGIHGIGSLGAAHYLTTHLGELFAETGDAQFSLVVECNYDGLRITGSGLLAGPFMWA